MGHLEHMMYMRSMADMQYQVRTENGPSLYGLRIRVVNRPSFLMLTPVTRQVPMPSISTNMAGAKPFLVDGHKFMLTEYRLERRADAMVGPWGHEELTIRAVRVR